MGHNLVRGMGGWALWIAAFCAPSLALAQLPQPEPGEVREYDASGTPRASPHKSEQRMIDEAAEFTQRERSCEAGSITACGDLGEAYELGIGTGQSRPIASILYTEACNTGSGLDCARLGRITLVALEDDAETSAFAAFEKACDLGSLVGCAYLARAWRDGTGTAQDVARGMAIGQEVCERGGAVACRDLAFEMQRQDPGAPGGDEINTLLLQACEGGDAEGCNALIYNIEYGEPDPGLPPVIDLYRRACTLEDGLACEKLGDAVFRGEGGERNTAVALQYYDRACYLEPELCYAAENIRAEPVLYEACQNDENSACAKLGDLYSRANSVLHDAELSRAYYEYACYAGATQACAYAARDVLGDGDNLTEDRATQAVAYLERGCGADHMYACSQLVDQIERSLIMAYDGNRIYRLKARLCEAGWNRECEELETAYLDDPQAPLVEAGARYLPPIDEGDIDWMEPYLTEEEREEMRTTCAPSEIEFRGKLYTDTVCIPEEGVIGGRALAPGAAPWQALIWRPSRAFDQDLRAADRVLCGGSHIARGWILTAAHCLYDDGGWITRRGYTVRLGVSNPRNDEGITYPVTRVYRHPDFDPETLAFDIGLIRYDPNGGRRAARAYPITIISTDRKTVSERVIRRGDPVYVYGWGWTDEAASTSTTQLRSAKLLLESPARCNGITQFGRWAWNSMLCAAGANEENACKGDSGGPLITYRDADLRPRVIGVVSSGRACGQADEASRYVRIAAARDWIDGVMGTAP